MRKLVGLGYLGLLTAICLLTSDRLEEARAGDQQGSLRLGLVSSLFRETPKSMAQMLAQPLKTLLETQTGLTGQLESTAEPLALARQLDEKQVDLAVFHGFEFAWVKQKYPELRPLLVVGNPQPLQAHLLVVSGCQAATCADLNGQALALPRRSREHLHLFLERRCAGGRDPKDFFAKVVRAPDTEDALDDLIEGTVQAALVDHADLQAYRQAKPERYARLRELLKSETFPTGVIAYRSGNLSPDTVQRIQTGMLSAHQTRRGRDLLSMCRMAGFDLPTPDFEQALLTIVRAYPPPPSK